MVCHEPHEKYECEHICVRVCVCVHARAHSVAQSCLTLCDSIDCNPPGSSVHGIFQAGILEWVAISFIYIYICFKIKLL